MSRPLAARVAYRIIAAPWYGWLYRGEFWTDADWQQRERRRRQWRKYRRAERGTA